MGERSGAAAYGRAGFGGNAVDADAAKLDERQVLAGADAVYGDRASGRRQVLEKGGGEQDDRQPEGVVVKQVAAVAQRGTFIDALAAGEAQARAEIRRAALEDLDEKERRKTGKKEKRQQRQPREGRGQAVIQQVRKKGNRAGKEKTAEIADGEGKEKALRRAEGKGGEDHQKRGGEGTEDRRQTRQKERQKRVQSPDRGAEKQPPLLDGPPQHRRAEREQEQVAQGVEEHI